MAHCRRSRAGRDKIPVRRKRKPLSAALHDALLLARAGRAASGKRAMAEHFEMIIEVLNDAQPAPKPAPRKKRTKKKVTRRRDQRRGT